MDCYKGKISENIENGAWYMTVCILAFNYIVLGTNKKRNIMRIRENGEWESPVDMVAKGIFQNQNFWKWVF